jgi:glucose-1-phosphate cytidylyltransferase
MAEPWRITLVDTGIETMTGGRLKRIADYLPDNEPFCLTYGDGVADIDIAGEIDYHRAHGRLATMTVVRPPGRFGAVTMDGDHILSFDEKPRGDGGWINGGFFVMWKKALDYIDGDSTALEQQPLTRIAADGQLRAYRHDGFWQCMDTLRDKRFLEQLWSGGEAPWKVWA